ncbi:hypothetical protein LINPERHAP2_LOCUS27791 [Linum perenne]
MTFGLGRLYLSTPITARNILFSSHNKATRNSLPQCQFRRQNHGGGVVKFDLAGKERILNPGFGLSQNGIDNSTGSSTKFMRRFCRMYFGRRQRISSASGSNPPEEHDLDQDGYSSIGGGGGNRDKIHGGGGGDGDRGGGESLGYGLLAVFGWCIMWGWWWWSQQEIEFSSPAEPYYVVPDKVVKKKKKKEEPSIAILDFIENTFVLLFLLVFVIVDSAASSSFHVRDGTMLCFSMCFAAVLELLLFCGPMWLLLKFLKRRWNRGDGAADDGDEEWSISDSWVFYLSRLEE